MQDSFPPALRQVQTAYNARERAVERLTLAIRAAHPEHSCGEIAGVCGLSRARVHQIVQGKK